MVSSSLEHKRGWLIAQGHDDNILAVFLDLEAQPSVITPNKLFFAGANSIIATISTPIHLLLLTI
jgi:hypothetical protein